MTARRVGGCALAVAAGLLPVLAFAGTFAPTPVEALANPRYVLPTAGAAAVTVATCLLTALATRIPAVTRSTAGAFVLAAYLALVLPSNVLGGPRRLLTSIPPLVPDGAELATVAVLAGLSSLMAAETVLRGKPVVRGLPLALLGTAAGLAVSAPAGAAAWLGPGAVLIVAAFLVLGAWPRGSGIHLAVVAVVPLVLAAGVAASLFAPGVLATRDRPLDARELIPQPVRPRQATSPLAQFPALHTGRAQVRLTVTTGRALTWLRYATLTAFDGSYWTSTATYWRAGTTLPEREHPHGTTTEHVRVEQPGPLGMLVSSGRPLEVSAAGLGVDPETGDVVLPDDQPVPPGYTVRSALASARPAELAADRPASGPAHDAAVAAFTGEAEKIAGAGRGYDGLRRLAAHFTSAAYAEDSSPSPPSGHGAWQIRHLMKETKRGTAEQYASAYAVLARSLGYDVRVVVGFRPATRRAGRYTITERDVDAWAEVRFERAGWVPFHPTPRGDRDRPPADRAEPAPEEEAASPIDAERHPSGHAAPAPASPRQQGPSWWWLLIPVVAGAAAAAVPLLKWTVRVRRRRTADPRGRVMAAWRETLDRSRDAGLRLAPGSTTGEAATAATTRFPSMAPPTADLLPLVDQAMYGGHEVGAAEGERAWALADAALAGLRTGLPIRRRMAAAMRPRWETLPISRRHARF
ncbi:transglutaminase domain-containing protein [Nonomuraea endophytica]|uniref:Transglutaminase-like putative cysteine protease n=1 Tax=Nonomuraea endophytica TaxID=714136 RepID=A0A7W8A0Z0_9ACTN|nr:transglutaminase domain-containing protein [Nonomuraea endophytica]MBB5076746.1 transglutaminase-like putative cysteine protease [Nonomuraea endophytica]